MTDRRWIAVWIWTALILTLTSIPNPPDLPVPSGTDKLVHASVYAVLALLVARAVGAGFTVRRTLGAVIAIAMLGGIDEWHQQFIPGRSEDLRDWAADSIGAVVGGAIGFAVQRKLVRA